MQQAITGYQRIMSRARWLQAAVRRGSGIGVLAGVLLLPLGVEAVGSGDLDPSFSGAGRVLTDFGPGSWDRAAAVAIQADGKLVVAGASNGDFALVRYLPDGTLDATCGSQGKVFTDCCSGNDTLVGGTGDDTLLGESDIDVCDGGAHGRGDTATGCEHVTGVP